MGKSKVGTSFCTARGKRKETEVDPPNFGGFEKLKGKALSVFKKLDTTSHKVIATKFFVSRDMGYLGLGSGLTTLMGNAGLEDLYSKQAQTYKSLTLEFIATLRKHTPDNEEEEPYITFSLTGRERTRTYEELRADWGIDAPDGEFVTLDDEGCNMFWSAITGALHKEHNDKNAYIPNPYLRLIHLFLNMAFVGLGEPTKVNFDGLRYLWAVIPLAQRIPDWVNIFVNKCLRKQGMERGGKLFMGGMISLIAMGLSIDLSAYTPVGGGHLFTNKLLVELKMLKDFKYDLGTSACWCFGSTNDRYLRLPRPPNNPLPIGNYNNGSFILPDQEFAQNFLELRHVAAHDLVNDKGAEDEQNEDDESDENQNEGGRKGEDIGMREANWSNWEVPLPQNQGQPWGQLMPVDMLSTQYQQYLQFQQFQEQRQQQTQQQEGNFFPFGNYQPQGYANQWLPDCTPNFQVPPTREGYWAEYMDMFTKMVDQTDLNYQVSLGVHHANVLNQVPNYKGPKQEDIDAFDMREVQKEIRRMERLEKRRREQGGPSGSNDLL